jgi:hypothetical protein
MPSIASPRPRAALALAGAAVLLAACAGGTPWGATPQHIPLPPLPRLEQVPAHIEAGTTAGAQRIAERVRAALAAQPRLAQAGLRVQGLEGGVMVVEGTVASPDDRALALATARQVAGVRDVVDRMAGP